MKPIYKFTSMSWLVDGLGLFNSIEEAKQAIEDNKLKHSLVIRISDKTKRQLQELTKDKNTTVSDLIRKLIDKEMKNNE